MVVFYCFDGSTRPAKHCFFHFNRRNVTLLPYCSSNITPGIIHPQVLLLFMIARTDLMGKTISYMYNGKFCAGKICRISGRIVTVKRDIAVNGHRFKKKNQRVHPDMRTKKKITKIFGVYVRGKLVPIDWK